MGSLVGTFDFWVCGDEILRSERRRVEAEKDKGSLEFRCGYL